MQEAPRPPPLLRRVGVIGDVHAEDAALAAVLNFLRGMDGLDALLCTGDVVTGPGDANRCCALLREADVLTVRGNHDRWFFAAGYDILPHFTPDTELAGANRLSLASLPITRRLDTVRGPLLLCHGLGNDDMAGVHPGDSGYALHSNHRLHALVGDGTYRFVINGHTHRRMVRTFDGLTIVNAGTLRADHQPGFLIVDFGAGVVQYYDVGESCEIREAGRLPLLAP